MDNLLLLLELADDELDLLWQCQGGEGGVLTESGQGTLNLSDHGLGLWALRELGEFGTAISFAAGDHSLDLLDKLWANTLWDLRSGLLLWCELEGDVLGRGGDAETLWKTVGLVGLKDSLGLLDDGGEVEVLGWAGDGDFGNFGGWALEVGDLGLEGLEVEVGRGELGLECLKIEVGGELGLQGCKVEASGELGLEGLEVELRRSGEFGGVKLWSAFGKLCQESLQLGDLDLLLFLGQFRELTLAILVLLDNSLDAGQDLLDMRVLSSDRCLGDQALEVEWCCDDWGRHF
jgi:hypothetical protein